MPATRRTDLLQPSDKTSAESKLALLTFFAALVALAYLATGIQLPLLDDVYITLRHARNLGQGNGLTYNLGERVLGTTSPLYALVLAFLHWATGADLVRLALPFWILCLGASAFVLFLLLGRGVLGLAGAIYLAVSPFLSGVAGMETTFFVFGNFLLIHQYRAGRTNLVFFLLPLLLLIRPDGVFLALVLTLHLAATRRGLPWRQLLLASALAGLWAVFSLSYYGSVVPQSMVAKYWQGRTTYWWPDSTTFTHGALAHFSTHWLDSGLLVVAVAGSVYLIWTQRQTWLAIPLLWLALYFGAYAANHIPAYHNYYFPFFSMLALAAFGSLGPGAQALAKAVGGTASRAAEGYAKVFGRTRSWRPIAFAGVALGAGLIARKPVLLTPGALESAPDHAYVAIGEYLRKTTATGAKVAAMEIGIIGYHSERFIVDFCGLVTPEVARKVSDRDTRFALEKYSPEFIVARFPAPATLEGGISPEELAASYERVFSSGGVGVFKPITTYRLAEAIKLENAAVFPLAPLPEVELKRLRVELAGRNVLADELPPLEDINRYGFHYLRVNQGGVERIEPVFPSGSADLSAMAGRRLLDFKTAEDLFGEWNEVKVEGPDGVEGDQAMVVTTLGFDPYLGKSIPDLATLFIRSATITMSVQPQRGCKKSNTEGLLFWLSKGDRSWGTAGKVVQFRVLADGLPHTYELDLSRHQGWRNSGVIDSLRFDPIKCPAKVRVNRIAFSPFDHGTAPLEELERAVLILRGPVDEAKLARLRETLAPRRVLVDELPPTAELDQYKYYFASVRDGAVDAVGPAISLDSVRRLAGPLRLSFDNQADLFGPWNQTRVEGPADHAMVVTTTGFDPYLSRGIRDLGGGFIRSAKVQMAVTPGEGCNDQNSHGFLYWLSKRDRAWGTNEKFVTFKVTADGKPHEYDLDLKGVGGWRGGGIIDSLRFDPIKCPARVVVTGMNFE